MLKRFSFAILILLLAYNITKAQVPQKINYQAVARNNTGAALVNQTINVRISIMQGATSLYTETRSVVTNALGLFNVQIGSPGASPVTGNFSIIDWATNVPEVKQIKIELDINNSNTFTDMGMQTLSSVPFALVAENTRKVGGFDVSTSEPNNEDILQWDGSVWEPGLLRIGTKPVVNTVPNNDDLLYYNGTNWVPKPSPKFYSIAGPIQAIPFGGGAAPFVFAGPTATITVHAGQTVTGNFTGVLGHGNNLPQPASFCVCWSEVAAGSPLAAFVGSSYPDGMVDGSPNETTLSANAFRVFPTAGSYKVGFCVKNKSTTTNFGANDYVNGVVIAH